VALDWGDRVGRDAADPAVLDDVVLYMDDAVLGSDAAVPE
jgi:hypothetical protein